MFTDADVAAAGRIGAKSELALCIGVQGFIAVEYFLFPKMSIGVQYTYKVVVDIQAVGEVTLNVLGATSVTSKTVGKSRDFGIGSALIAKMNLTLHF
jgi:hypothetical protein